MDTGTNTQPNSNSHDPYLLLGLKPGASFDEIQKARDKKLIRAGDDQINKAKIEAAYDSLLMTSLKSRQLGNASNEAINASRKEDVVKQAGDTGPSALLTRMKKVNLPVNNVHGLNLLPKLDLPSGQQLTIRISLGILALLLVLIIPTDSVELILSLSTIGLLISQVRRGRTLISSILWSIILLSIGILFGSLLLGSAHSIVDHTNTFPSERLEAIPAIVLLWLGTLFLS